MELGVSINPVAFLVVQDDNVKLLPVSHSSAIDKLLDYIPDLMDKVNTMINKKMDNDKELKNKINEEINRYNGINQTVVVPKGTKSQDRKNFKYNDADDMIVEDDENLDEE